MILLIPSSILVGLLAFLGSYSQLMADDFCSVYYGERLGVLRSVWYWYITWHGGYSAALADGYLGLFGRAGIEFVVPLTILIWLIVLVWMINLVLQRMGYGPAFLPAAALATLLLAGTFILSPSIKTSLLWWGGLRGYIPPLVIFPVYVGMYLNFSKQAWPPLKLILWCLSGFLAIVFSAGFSETFTPLQLVILVCWSLWALVSTPRRKQDISFLLAGMAGALLGLVLMVAAPGNSERQAFYPPPPGLFEMIGIVLNGCLYFAKTIFADPGKTIALIGLIAAGFVTGGLISKKQETKTREAFFIVIVGLAFIIFCFPPAAYGQSTFPSDHTLVIPTYILALTVISAGFMLGRSSAGSLNKNGSVAFPGLVLLTLIFIGYSEFTTSRSYYLEIPSAITYAEDWQLRDEQINAAKLAGEETILVASIKNWIGILEPISNPKFFVNSCMRLYYDVNVVSDKDDAFK